ncbi:MAG TPA: M23 family metallopeptidase, partial [Polyangiaceae bacterium]|nr:M23 family metallopeptidase [Polyangiaceae bacterium]
RVVRVTAPAAAAGSAAHGLNAACPRGTLPDANACVPVPLNAEAGGLALPEERNAHRDRQGRWQEYDHIPRLPERPEDYRQYRLPVPPPAEQSFVTSGYDLHLPDAEQRRGADLHAVGHGGIDIAQKRGTEVHLVRLEHQEGDASVVYVGPLFGNTVVTRHLVREGGLQREYVVLFGHLERAASTIARSTVVPDGTVLGFVGDSGSPGAVHLHYEARRVREGYEAMKLEPGDITKNSRTVACDPRNVLPLL